MFRMTVSDVFFIRGRGTVATGQVEAGTLRVGDTVLLNGAREVKVDGIEAFRKVLDEAGQGMNIGVLLKSLDKDDIKGGDVLSDGTPPLEQPASFEQAPQPADVAQSQDAANRALGRD